MSTTSSPPKPPTDRAIDRASAVPVDGRDSRWVAHRVARRQELVEAALRAIRTHGPGVGMDEIAVEARTSKTVIYRHLGDRLGLYLAVCDAVDARILRDMDRAARTSRNPEGVSSDLTGGSVLEVLRAVIDSYLKLVARDPDVYRFVVRRPQVPLPDGTDPVTGLSSRIADNLTAVFAQLAPASTDDAAARQRRARSFAWGLVGMVKESADRWLEDPHGLEREDLAAHLAALATHGLAGTAPEAATPPTAPTDTTTHARR